MGNHFGAGLGLRMRKQLKIPSNGTYSLIYGQIVDMFGVKTMTMMYASSWNGTTSGVARFQPAIVIPIPTARD